MCDDIKPSEHKHILEFLNEAVRTEDLVFGMPETAHSHPTDPHPEHTHHDEHRHERKPHVAERVDHDATLEPKQDPNIVLVEADADQIASDPIADPPDGRLVRYTTEDP